MLCQVLRFGLREWWVAPWAPGLIWVRDGRAGAVGDVMVDRSSLWKFDSSRSVFVGVATMGGATEADGAGWKLEAIFDGGRLERWASYSLTGWRAAGPGW